MKTAVCALLAGALLLGAVPARCAEDEGVDENALIRAQVFAEQGDLRRALTVLVKIMREGKEEELRSSARSELNGLGLSEKEIFTLDPAKGKPDNLDALLDRVAKFQAHRRRAVLDHEYATQILRDALFVRFEGEELQADLNVKDAAKATEIMVKLALDDEGEDIARESQEFLESIGVAGAKIDEVKKATANETVPDAVLKNLKAAALFMRLSDYRDWRENVDVDDMLLKQRMAKEYGLKVFNYLKKNHSNDEVWVRNGQLTKYWSSLNADEPKVKVPAMPTEKAAPEQKSGEEKDPKF